MKALEGFIEQFGINVEIYDYVTRVLKDASRNLGYQQINLPIIECATSYSEQVVGKSPWPEWNTRGCFYFNILNYEKDYDETPSTERVLLIPEGTVSLTRWLGTNLGNNTIRLPIKASYLLKCYRNELISSLSSTKKREFTQFGLEILGSDSPQSDAEILCMTINCLTRLGIKKEEIRIRINDISIFNHLICECHLETQSIQLKELLDSLAEIKAGKNIERKSRVIADIHSILSKATLTEDQITKWNLIIEQANYEILAAYSYFGNPYKPYFDRLTELKTGFQTLGVILNIDLCVIRSHEYYTSISYEIDVVTKKNYIEIAGGGRYDRLVSSFVPADFGIQQVPCTGFAFGLERLIDLLIKEYRISCPKTIQSRFHFQDHPQQTLIPEDSSATAYIKAFVTATNSDIPTNIQFK